MRVGDFKKQIVADKRLLIFQHGKHPEFEGRVALVSKVRQDRFHAMVLTVHGTWGGDQITVYWPPARFIAIVDNAFSLAYAHGADSYTATFEFMEHPR